MASISGEVGEDFVVADFEPGDILLIPLSLRSRNCEPRKRTSYHSPTGSQRLFASVYEPIKARRGMAYYDVEYKGK